VTGRLHYNAVLWDSKGCVDWVPWFFNLGWFHGHGHGYGSSSADLHHPREALLKSFRATNDKKRGIINMNVERVQEKFIHHPKNPVWCYQIWVYRFAGLRRVRYVEVLPEHMKSNPQSSNRRLRNTMRPDKKPSAIEDSFTKFSRRVKNVTSVATSSLVAPTT
jgi:hypothetical protein